MTCKTTLLTLSMTGLVFGAAGPAWAVDQTVPGAGNEEARQLAEASPLVKSAYALLVDRARGIDDVTLRKETLDALTNERTCVRHRAGLDDAKKTEILSKLQAEGLYAAADASTFPGGAKAGVFPPVRDESSVCPKLPQPFFAAPGSVYGGHHSYPGGLAVHTSFNDTSDIHLAAGYRQIYGNTGPRDLPEVRPDRAGEGKHADVFLDQDIMVAAPLWHDWAKTIVFQWNADGSEFAEFNFGGNGTTDALGTAGDSRTGGHHILGVAETMKRGLAPAFVIAQASAHSVPTSGNEYKVVNWLRAAAIIAEVDPVATGYLRRDAAGHYRLPALRGLGDVDLNALSPSQTNFLVEYVLHNISDSDFTCTGPALTVAQTLLAKVAPDFGFDPADVANYQRKFRNPALSFISAERLYLIYSQKGLAGVKAELQNLRCHHVF